MNLFSIFAGVPDAFRAFRASSWKDVGSNASRHMDFKGIRQRSQEDIESYSQSLKDKGLDDWIGRGQVGFRRLSNHALDAVEMGLGTIGSASSLVGGSAGYVAKGALKLTGKATAEGAKLAGSGIKEINNIRKQITLKGKDPDSFSNRIKEKVFPHLDEPIYRDMNWEGTKAGARWAGKAALSVAKDTGREAMGVGKFLWNNRNTRGMTLGVAGVSAAGMGIAYDYGMNDVKHEIKMQQVSASEEFSEDALGTYLRPTPKENRVQDFGAGGELVFALHNLRSGG